jgi:hypothetical protein
MADYARTCAASILLGAGWEVFMLEAFVWAMMRSVGVEMGGLSAN